LLDSRAQARMLGPVMDVDFLQAEDQVIRAADPETLAMRLVSEVEALGPVHELAPDEPQVLQVERIAPTTTRNQQRGHEVRRASRNPGRTGDRFVHRFELPDPGSDRPAFAHAHLVPEDEHPLPVPLRASILLGPLEAEAIGPQEVGRKRELARVRASASAERLEARDHQARVAVRTAARVEPSDALQELGRGRLSHADNVPVTARHRSAERMRV
jgi:hypothetical protein